MTTHHHCSLCISWHVRARCARLAPQRHRSSRGRCGIASWTGAISVPALATLALRTGGMRGESGWARVRASYAAAPAAHRGMRPPRGDASCSLFLWPIGGGRRRAEGTPLAGSGTGQAEKAKRRNSRLHVADGDESMLLHEREGDGVAGLHHGGRIAEPERHRLEEVVQHQAWRAGREGVCSPVFQRASRQTLGPHGLPSKLSCKE
eukprot:scaffold3541_cov117-Isochrysis_galbana.AAC.9